MYSVLCCVVLLTCILYLWDNIFVTGLHGVIDLRWNLISVNCACIRQTLRNRWSLFKILNHKHHLQRNKGEETVSLKISRTQIIPQWHNKQINLGTFLMWLQGDGASSFCSFIWIVSRPSFLLRSTLMCMSLYTKEEFNIIRFMCCVLQQFCPLIQFYIKERVYYVFGQVMMFRSKVLE